MDGWVDEMLQVCETQQKFLWGGGHPKPLVEGRAVNMSSIELKSTVEAMVSF